MLASSLQLDTKPLEGRIRSSMSLDPLECLQCEAPRECSDYCCPPWQVLNNKLPMPTKIKTGPIDIPEIIAGYTKQHYQGTKEFGLG